MFEQDIDLSTTQDKLATLKKLGVPYEDEYIANANEELMKQAKEVTTDLAKEGREYITNLYKDGDIIGYLDLIEDKAYHESAMVMEDSEI